MIADIGLLPGVTPSMAFKVAIISEKIVTLQTSIVLLPGVSLHVFLQVT